MHGRSPSTLRQSGLRQGMAGIWGVAEASAMVGEYDRVGAEQSEQLAEQEGGRDPRRPTHAGMGKEGDLRIFLRQPVEVGHSHDHGGNHHGIDAGSGSDGDLPAHMVEIAGQARHIARGTPAWLPDRVQRLGDSFHARGERRIGLVRQPVIVLDVIDAPLREAGGQGCELGSRKPLRLERRAGQGTLRCSDTAPEPMQSMARPAERLRQAPRQRDVGKHDVLMQGRVAEQHIDELAGVLPDGVCGQRDRNLE